MKQKRVLTILMMAVLACSVTACGDEKEPSQEETMSVDAGKEESEDQEEEPEEDTKETADFAGQEYYIVEKGESLLSISKKIYGKDYTDELCELNGLEDANKIYAGQKLLLLDK